MVVELVQKTFSYIGIKICFAFVFVVLLALVVAMSIFYLYQKRKWIKMWSACKKRSAVLCKNIKRNNHCNFTLYCSFFIASLIVLVNMGDAGIIVKTFFSVAEWILFFYIQLYTVIFAIMPSPEICLSEY